jgi:hypothetical protein
MDKLAKILNKILIKNITALCDWPCTEKYNGEKTGLEENEM